MIHDVALFTGGVFLGVIGIYVAVIWICWSFWR
jgi:hypothetical protein